MKNEAARSGALAFAIAAALATASVQAQDDLIAQVIVTAQKREQNVQDVPIAITALSGQLLQDTGVRDIKDLTVLTPGLIVTSTSNEALTTARIRGIGTVGDNPGLESSVGVSIDGVYRPRNGVSFGDLGELERVEVLKGPQGTLFGTNTTAGVINILTKRPESKFGADVELGTGNYGALEGSASLTGPIAGDVLSARLFVAKRERDGFLDIRTGAGPRVSTEDYNRDFYTVRGQLLFTPSDQLNVRLIADYTKRDEECCAAPTVYIPTSTLGIAGIVNALAGGQGMAVPANPFARLAYSNRLTDQLIMDKGVSAELNWKLTPATQLTSITGYRKWDSTNAQDPDFTTADIWYRPNDGTNAIKFETLSEELRVAGGNERVQWLGGVYFSKEDLDAGAELLYGTVYRTYWSLLSSGGTNPSLFPATLWPTGSGQDDLHKQRGKTYAAFTNDTLTITDNFDVTFGVRYTKTEKDLTSYYHNRGTGVACVNAQLCFPWVDPNFNNAVLAQSLDEKKWTGTIKPTWRFNEDIMAYASYARGYKAGGFNLDRERLINPAAPAPTVNPFMIDPATNFAPEIVDAYEIGAKTSWFNKSLVLNAAVFYQDYTGFQLNTFTGTTYVVASIPRVTSQGVDLDMLWVTPIHGLHLQGGVVYSDTHYGNFTPTDSSQVLLPNNRISFAPLWSGSLAGSYEMSLGSQLALRTNIAYKYMAHYNTGSDLNPHKVQGSYGLLDARIGLGTQDDKWTVEAWAQNLLDKDYYQVVFDQPLQTNSGATFPENKTLAGFLGAPRTYGLTVRFNF